MMYQLDSLYHDLLECLNKVNDYTEHKHRRAYKAQVKTLKHFSLERLKTLPMQLLML